MSGSTKGRFSKPRRQILGAAALLSAAPLVRATNKPLKEINFVEAVHNLGYINLYVGQHAKIFEKYGLKLNVSAAGGDTQAFAAVLGRTAQFAIGDATMAQMSREQGGPGVVVGTVVQRAHYFGVSKSIGSPIKDPKQFKGLTFVTSPEPNTNFSVTKKILEDHGLKPRVDTKILEVNPGTEIAAMLAGRADIAVAYQPSVANAMSQGAKVVFDFASYMGPFCNTGIMVLPEYVKANPDVVQALVNAFEEASQLAYAKPEFAKEVARKEFPDMAADVVNKAIEMQFEFKIPAQTVKVDETQWTNLISMQKYLGNIKGTIPFKDIIDNSFAEKAAATVKLAT
jgi:NitT/TauT family transport system substrate-binding protein